MIDLLAFSRSHELQVLMNLLNNQLENHQVSLAASWGVELLPQWLIVVGTAPGQNGGVMPLGEDAAVADTDQPTYHTDLEGFAANNRQVRCLITSTVSRPFAVAVQIFSPCAVDPHTNLLLFSATGAVQHIEPHGRHVNRAWSTQLLESVGSFICEPVTAMPRCTLQVNDELCTAWCLLIAREVLRDRERNIVSVTKRLRSHHVLQALHLLADQHCELVARHTMDVPLPSYYDVGIILRKSPRN